MKKLIRFLAIIFYITVTFIAVGRAQDTVLARPHGKLDSLHSVILKQERLFQVFLPAGYKPGNNQKYDVLYVLDGSDHNTGLVSDIQRFVGSEGFMPPTIIVSVLRIDRNAELTPTSVSSWKGSGGGASFLSFIKNELIPYVNKNYPSNGDNTLWGHSLSGMFAVYAMINEPDLFKSYIAIDPSMWWDDGYVVKKAAEKLRGISSGLTLFIAGRENSLSGMKTDTLETVLKNTAPKNLNWKLQVYPDETHTSVKFKSTYDALRFSYLGLTSSIGFHPMKGIVLKDQPYPIWYFDDTTRVHYTLDGSAPTQASPKVSHTVMVTGPAKVTYKLFGNRSRYDQSATGIFSVVKIPHAVAQPAHYLPGGFNYAYYDLKGDSAIDLKNKNATKSGIAGKDFDLDKQLTKTPFVLVIDGFLEIKESGYYVFAMAAGKGSKLSVANLPLISCDGDDPEQYYSAIIPLSKGFYPLQLKYNHRDADARLDLVYVSPGNLSAKKFVPVPLELQYGRK